MLARGLCCLCREAFDDARKVVAAARQSAREVRDGVGERRVPSRGGSHAFSVECYLARNVCDAFFDLARHLAAAQGALPRPRG